MKKGWGVRVRGFQNRPNRPQPLSEQSLSSSLFSLRIIAIYIVKGEILRFANLELFTLVVITRLPEFTLTALAEYSSRRNNISENWMYFINIAGISYNTDKLLYHRISNLSVWRKAREQARRKRTMRS
jgi:hypothetical protein